MLTRERNYTGVLVLLHTVAGTSIIYFEVYDR